MYKELENRNRELPEIPFKHFNPKRNVIEFYTHLFKRFELYAKELHNSVASI